MQQTRMWRVPRRDYTLRVKTKDLQSEETSMKRWATVLSALLTMFGVVLLLSQTSQYAVAANHAGWVVLFDGNNLDNWNTIGTANWKLDEDGIVAADGGNGFLVSKNSYKDFELRVEFWLEPRTNSGVFIRCTDPNSVSGKTAYEVNIWDTRPEQKYGTGALVDVAAVDPMPHAGGKWNIYDITAKGDTFTVILNGQKTVDGAKSDKFASGRIALQHGMGATDDKGVVKFRKVEIKPL
jgi:hypothetical protein